MFALIVAGYVLLPSLALAAPFCASALSPSSAHMPAVAAKPTQTTAPTTGHAITIFAQFHSEEASQPNVPAWANTLFDPVLAGSLTHFYSTMSFGQHLLTGEVASRRYASLQEAPAYLASDPQGKGLYGQFVLEILRQADADIDFSRFDSDGPDGIANSGDDDGVVDVVFINTLSAPRDFLFRGATGIATLGFKDHFATDDTGINGEAIRIDPRRGTIQQVRTFSEAVGVMAHEYGHLLGLPDLFNTFFTSRDGVTPADDSAGIGHWGLMGWGATGWHGDDGPNSFSAWSRMRLGWARTREIAQAQETLHLPQVGQDGALYKIPIDTGEFFLLEYRRRTSTYYDRHIPGEGLLVWHFHSGRPTLECADGRWQDAGFPVGQQPAPSDGRNNLDFWAHDPSYSERHAGNKGDATDPFDGAAYTAFTTETNPAAYNKRGTLGIRIEDIRLDGDLAIAQVQTRPMAVEIFPRLSDANLDGVLTVNEEGTVLFHVVNTGGLVARNVRVSVHTQDPLLEVLQKDVWLEDIQVGRASGQPADGSGFPRIRLGDELSSNQRLDLVLELFVDGVPMGTSTYPIDAIRSYPLAAQVTDPQGLGLPGIEVHVLQSGNSPSFRSVTDTEGSFEIGIPPGFYSYFIAPEGTKYANRTGPFQVRGPTDLEIVLWPVFPVTGIVTDPEGMPLVGVSVRTFWRTGSALTFTSTNGAYTLPLPRGRYTLSVRSETDNPDNGYPLQSFPGVQVEGPRVLDMVLSKGVAVTGHLLDPSGAGIGDLRLLAAQVVHVFTPQAAADETGTAELNLIPGVYRLRTSPPFSASGRTNPRFVQTEVPLVSIQADTTIQIVHQPTHQLTGSVQDAAARPYFDARLTFNGLDTANGRISASLEADGTFQAHLPAGRFQVAFVPSGRGSTPAQVLETVAVSGDGSAAFSTDIGQPMTGTLLDYSASGPMHILAVSPSLAVAASAEIQTDGSFELYLKPGRYQFTAAHNHTAFWPLDTLDVSAHDHHEFHLPGGATLSGRVFDDLGQPVSNPTIVLSHQPPGLTHMGSFSEARPHFFLDSPGYATAVQGDQEGFFALSAPPGTYTATILPGGRENSLVRQVTLDGTGRQTFTLPVYDTYSEVYGQIVAETDRPRGDIRLLFYNQENGALAQVQSNGGTYHHRLPAGTYHVKAGLFSPVHGFFRIYDLGQVALAQDRRWDIRLGAANTAVSSPTRSRPRQVILWPNYPNPFNPSTTISYQLATASDVSLSVYNILGQRVRLLVNEAQPAGSYTVQWNGLDRNDRAVASGVYLYRLTTHKGRFGVTKKMVLVH